MKIKYKVVDGAGTVAVFRIEWFGLKRTVVKYFNEGVTSSSVIEDAIRSDMQDNIKVELAHQTSWGTKIYNRNGIVIVPFRFDKFYWI